METKKQIIDSLFYEAFYFSQKTPVSEFEKYNEYAKNFAKSFNRLIQEIDDPDQRKEIIEWCITNDELLTIEIIATELSDHETNILKRNYGVLKNLFLNGIEIPNTIPQATDETQTLEELFINPDSYEKCINVLKEVDPPILSIDNVFIGKEKGALVLWVDYLKRFNLIDIRQNDKTYSKLISEAFNFSISDATFRKVSVRAKQNYESDFNQLLSQVYQSVKTGN